MTQKRTIEGVLRQIPIEGVVIELTPGDPVWTVDEVFEGFLNNKVRVTVEVIQDTKGHVSEKCPECQGDLGPAEGAPLLACMSCGRIYRTDQAPGLIYTGVRYAEIDKYAPLLGVRFPEKR